MRGLEGLENLEGFGEYVPGAQISRILRELVNEVEALGAFVMDLNSGFRLASFIRESKKTYSMELIVGIAGEYARGIASRHLGEQLSSGEPAEILVQFNTGMKFMVRRIGSRFLLGLISGPGATLGMLMSSVNEYAQAIEDLLKNF